MSHKNKIISRNLQSEKIHIREADENGNRYIEGYAIVFNQRSKLIRDWDGEYYEIIDTGAVDKVLQDPEINVIATVDHWRDKMLGRTKSGTLELIKDEKGLMYRILVPDTQLGRDIATMIERGDYYESSFIFTIDRMEYDKTQDPNVRTIYEIEKLFDVSIVIDGAYANTAVKMRNQEWQLETETNADFKTDILKRKVQILKSQQ
ncbi:MAG: HK97 family phage prohead protease [Salinivirgaceae bacterium]